MEQIIACSASAEELGHILRTCADTFGFDLTSRRTGSPVLAGGSLLALNANRVRWSAQIIREENRLRIVGATRTLPWTRTKVERILAYRLTQIADFITVSLSGGSRDPFLGPSAHAPFALTTAPGDFFFASAWLAMSFAACALATLAATTLLALTLMDAQIRDLARRALLIEQLNFLPLPSRQELDSIDFGFRLGCAINFAGPMAFFIALLYGAVQLLAEVWAPLSRAVFWIFLFLLLQLGVSLYPLVGWPVLIAYALLIPLSAHMGYSLVWSRKREKRRSNHREYRHPILAGVILLALAVVAAPSPSSDEGFLDALVLFRDKVFLPYRPGRALACFYYRHTLYAAEILKPWFDLEGPQRAQRVVRLSAPTPFNIENHLRTLEVYCDARPEGSEGPYDAILSNEPLNNPKAIAVSPSTTLEELKTKLREQAGRIYPANDIGWLQHVGWRSLYSVGPVALALTMFSLLSLPLGLARRKFSSASFRTLAWVGITFMVLGIAAHHASRKDLTRTLTELRERGHRNDAAGVASFLKDPRPDIRLEAVYALYHLFKEDRSRNRDIYPELVQGLKDDDLRIRLWTCGALGYLGDVRAVEPLLRSLEDDFFVRYRAAGALGDLRDPRAIPHLRRLIREDEWYVGIYALQALRDIEPGKH